MENSPGSPKYVDIKTCRSCKKELALNLFVKNKASKNGIDTICLECSRQKVKQWRLAGNRKPKQEYQRAKEMHGEVFLKQRREIHKRYYDKVLRSPRVLKTPEEKRALKNYHDSLRRARYKAKNWEPELSSLVFQEAYHLAQLRYLATKIKWDVDHIIPLKGKTVSGLHVWNNIQVIPASTNRKKWNSYESI